MFRHYFTHIHSFSFEIFDLILFKIEVKCQIWSKNFGDNIQFFSRIKESHSQETYISIPCGFLNCPQHFGDLNALRRHMRNRNNHCKTNTTEDFVIKNYTLRYQI